MRPVPTTPDQRSVHGTRPRQLVRGCVALLAFALTVGCASATADTSERRHRDDRYRAYGRVIDVRPVYRKVAVREPSRDCRAVEYGRPYRQERPSRHERPQRYDDRQGANVGGAVIGGLIGGSIGNRISRNARHEGRIAATVAGAVIGSAIGREVGHARHDRPQRHGRPDHRPRRHCVETVTTRYETRLDYYDVTYVFRGRTFHSQRQRDPGTRIEIDVSRSPSRR